MITDYVVVLAAPRNSFIYLPTFYYFYFMFIIVFFFGGRMIQPKRSSTKNGLAIKDTLVSGKVALTLITIARFDIVKERKKEKKKEKKEIVCV